MTYVKSNKIRAQYFTALFASTALTALFAPATFAQTGQDAEARQDEIIVTAQRREQSLQDVPLAVSTFSGAELEAQGVADLTEIGQTTPNVTLEVSRGTNSTLTAFIRGVGQQDPVAGFEAGVGIYIDDVVLNRPQAAVLEVYDVQRIEVLRGPQGTLYGRNTIGGAIKYVSKPLADTVEFGAKANLGSYNQVDLILNGSVPLSETFRVGGSVASLTRDGFGSNLNTGADNYNRDVLAGRLSAEWDATDKLSFRINADMTEDNSLARQGHRLTTSGVTRAPVLSNVFDTRAGLVNPAQKVEAQGIGLTASYEFNDQIDLKYIFGQRSDESTTPIDFDSLPGADVDVPAIYENEQTSHELQVLFENDTFAGVGGLYYLDANAKTVFDVILAVQGSLINLPGLTAQTFGNVDTQVWAAYGDLTWQINPQWALSVGGRYTEDERSSIVRRATLINGPSPSFGGNGTVIATTSNFNGSDTFDAFTPRVSVAFEPNADHNLYVSYSQGFKGGGFDPRGLTTAARDFNGNGTVDADDIFEFMQFDSETVDSYEIGWKASLNGGKIRSNAALFFADYTDVQIPGSVGFTPAGGAPTFLGITTNAASAEMTGLEWEGSAILAEDFGREGSRASLNWSYGYIDAKFNEYINELLGGNISSRAKFQNTPKTTASATLNYSMPQKLLGREGALGFITGWSYRSASTQFEFPNEQLDQKAFSLFDASLNWTAADGKLTVGLHGKNLTDEEYKVAGYNFLNATTGAPTLGVEGVLTAFYGNPRTVTLSLGYKY